MLSSIITIVQVLVLLLTAIVGLITVRATRKKAYAEANESDSAAAGSITTAAIALLEPLRAQVTALEAQVANQAIQLAEMKKVEEYLRARLHEKDQEVAEIKAAHRALITEKNRQIERLQDRVDDLESYVGNGK